LAEFGLLPTRRQSVRRKILRRGDKDSKRARECEGDFNSKTECEKVSERGQKRAKKSESG